MASVLLRLRSTRASFQRPVLRTLSTKDPISISDVPSREAQVEALEENEFDMLIIGGGSTGVGCALDAVTRGLKVALVEREDFASGASSRSTKLIHGGVRYLEKAVFNLDYGQYTLVRDALRERAHFFNVAPHISTWLPIMLPLYAWWKVPYMYAGVLAYDAVAGFPSKRSHFLTRSAALDKFPMLKPEGLKGAVVYYDGQQDDARMNVTLAMTAAAHGAVLANYTSVQSLTRAADGKVSGATVRDEHTGKEFGVRARTVVSAAGPFTDGVRKMEDGAAQDIVMPASGAHVVMPDYYSPTDMGLIDPATSDGRVIFFLPWQGHTICGTTDMPCEVERLPRSSEEEINWITSEVEKYLSPELNVRRSDVLSAWSGIRPLVKDPDASNTEAISREHLVHTSPDSGLITVAGGKWTTYREMAEDAVDAAVKEGQLAASPCVTLDTPLLGARGWSPNLYIQLIQQYGLDTEVARHLAAAYGDQAFQVAELSQPTGARWPKRGVRLVESFPYIHAEIEYGVREYARSVVDILARRTRLAFLNRSAAEELVEPVLEAMAHLLRWDEARIGEERKAAKAFLASFAGPTPTQHAFFRGASQADIRAAFDRFDADGSGKIDARELQALAAKLGAPLDERELNQALEEMDMDYSGTVEFEEFQAWWNSEYKSETGRRLEYAMSGGSAAESYP